MVQGGDVTAGASMQVSLAAMGTLAFPIANAEELADDWQPAAIKVSNLSFIVVLAGGAAR
jgi:hypothetical protein